MVEAVLSVARLWACAGLSVFAPNLMSQAHVEGGRRDLRAASAREGDVLALDRRRRLCGASREDRLAAVADGQ
jgi:hypothetical protein